MPIPHIRTPYDLGEKPAGWAPAIDELTGEVEVSLTVQSERDNCDINKIIAKYEKTGILPRMKNLPEYLDVSSAADYHAAQNVVAAAMSTFHGLPSEIRLKFDNDPAAFLAFCDDPKNGEHLLEMGLRSPPPPPEKALAPQGAPPEGVPPSPAPPAANT